MNKEQKFRHIGFIGITNIPLYETNCKKCGKKIKTSTKKGYCLKCKPLPIKCD